MWCLFDAHSDDGKLHGYTPETLDAVVGLDGFSVAVESVGWLVIAPNYLEMPNFGTHNGKGAKRRAEDTEAKRVRRLSEKCPQDLRTESGPEKRREEKRREIQNPPNPTRGEVTRAVAKPSKSVSDEDVSMALLQNRTPEAVGSAIREFVTYRRSKSCPVGHIALGKLLERWREMGDAAVIEAINNSIQNDYQGVFVKPVATATGKPTAQPITAEFLVAEMERKRARAS
jgi:hypothetical protein